MKRIQLLGVELTDYNLRESMRKVDEFLRNGKVSTIGYITTKGLIEAGEIEEIKNWMMELDLTIPADADILHAAGVEAGSRIHEVEENLFFKEFLKKIVRGKKTVFVLSDTKEQMGELSKILVEYQEHLKIVGTYAMEELTAEDDYLVNEINIAGPDVIISNLSSPKRENFFKSNHMKLNAEIWLMLKNGMKLGNKNQGVFAKLYDKMLRKVFRRRVMQSMKETGK